MDVWALLTSIAIVQLLDVTYYDLNHIDLGSANGSTLTIGIYRGKKRALFPGL
jgi:hypothetical protein